MSELANLYFHIDVNTDNEGLRESKIYFEEIVRDYASKIFKQDVRVHVEVIDGSIKSRIYVIGLITLAIGQYGSFRAGVDQIIYDSKLLQQLVVSDLYKQGIDEQILLDIKRPIATPNKIRRLFLRIDRLEMNLDNLTRDEIKKEIENIKKYTFMFTREMEPKDIEMLSSEIANKYLPEPIKLPSTIKSQILAINRREKLSIVASPLKLSYEKDTGSK